MQTKANESMVTKINDLGVQLFINYCAIIRKTNLTDDYGTVWKSKYFNGEKMTDGKHLVSAGFYLGLGDKPKNQIRVWLPMSEWDQCYFAKELPRAPEGEELNADEAIMFLKSQV